MKTNIKNDDAENNKSDKNYMLEIETLRKEYAIVLNQYQEAMKTYINELSENETKNKCSKFKKFDKNVSQLCYDKIWHEQGCLTDAPQVNANETLDQLVTKSYNTSISKNKDDIIKCYGSKKAVPENNIIKNGNFSNPSITNNSFKYIYGDSEVPNWNFNGGALMNNSRAWGYEMPYPNGNQAVSLELTSSISQTVNLKKNIKYNLKLFCSGRNCCDGVNPIKIELRDSNNTMILNILKITPTIVWSEYDATFTSPDTKEYKLTFSGITKTKNKSSGIQNIKLIEKTNAIYPNMMDYISIKGKTWWGTGELLSKKVETESECIALCESDGNCTGATYNPTRLCWTRYGESEITPGLMDDPIDASDYALVKKIKYKMTLLKSLNSKLLTLNEQIIDKINKKNLKFKIESFEVSKQFEDYHVVLLKHKKEIEEQLDDYENIESQYGNSSIYVKQQHWTYNIFVILVLIILFITIKKVSEGDNMISVFLIIGVIWAFYIFIIKFYNK
jgi:hypothetical protein